jgi:hypothetical protein
MPSLILVAALKQRRVSVTVDTERVKVRILKRTEYISIYLHVCYGSVSENTRDQTLRERREIEKERRLKEKNLWPLLQYSKLLAFCLINKVSP